MSALLEAAYLKVLVYSYSVNLLLGNPKIDVTPFFIQQDSSLVFFAANYAPKFLFQFASLCWRSNIIPFCILQIASFCHGKLISWNAGFGMKMVGFEFKNGMIKVSFVHALVSIFLLIVIQRYEIKSPPWTILLFRILGIFSDENIERLGVFMFQTWDNSQLCIDSQYSSQ